MNYYQAFEAVKNSITKFDSTKFTQNFAIQVTMTNKDCGGIFYIEYKDGILNIEPYNYYDNSVDITAGYSDLCKALSGKLSLGSTKLNISGDSEILSSFISAIEFKEPAKEKKTPAKKTVKKEAAKKSSCKTSSKKESAKPEVKKTAAKTAVKKDESSKKAVPEKKDTSAKTTSSKKQ